MSTKNIGRNTTFLQNLNKVVEKSPLKKKDVAEKLGIDPSTLSGLLSGKSKPSFDLLLDIAQLFHVSLDWLTGIKTDAEEDNHMVYIVKTVEIMQTLDKPTQADIYRAAEKEKLLLQIRSKMEGI